MDGFLAALELLSGAVWVGGLVAIAVVARVARRLLHGPQRVAFFRDLGRGYLKVGGAALVVAYADGAVLLARGDWSAERTATVAVAAALLFVVVAGVAQARSLTRLRAVALVDSAVGEALVARRARRAGMLRGLIAGLSVALVALAAAMLG